MSVVTLLLSGPSLARADEAPASQKSSATSALAGDPTPPDASAPATAPAPQRRERLASAPAPQRRERSALFIQSKNTGSGRAVASAIARRLAKRSEIDFEPLGALLNAKDDGRAKIDVAFASVAQGETQLTNLEVEKGLATLSAAVAKLEARFDIVGTDEALRARYVKALTALALAHFLAGHQSATSEWLSHALTLDPKVDYDKTRFPPKMKELFDAVHFLATELGMGKAVVTTVPPLSLVTINGKEVGRAPAHTDTTPVGRNLVTVTALGYQPKTVILNVKGGKDVASVQVSLTALTGQPLELLSGAVDDAAGTKMTRPREAATSLGVDLLFLGRVKENGDTFQLALYAYDKAAGRVVGHAKGTVRVLMVEDDIDKVLDGVFAAIKVTRMPPTPKPQGPGFFARMVGSKWFWPVVGVVAGAAAIAGATVGIVAATQSDHRRRNAILLPAFSYR